MEDNPKRCGLTAVLQPSEDARPPLTYSRRPTQGPLSLPNGTPVSTLTPLEGISRCHLVGFRYLFFALSNILFVPLPRWGGMVLVTSRKTQNK